MLITASSSEAAAQTCGISAAFTCTAAALYGDTVNAREKADNNAVIFTGSFIMTPPYLYKQTAAEAADRVYSLSFKYLGSVGTDAYHAYMAAYQFLETGNIALAVCGELIEAPAL